MKATMLALLLGGSAAAAAGPALANLPPAQLQARQQSDLDTVLRYRDGLRQVVAYAAAQPQLFPPAPAAAPAHPGAARGGAGACGSACSTTTWRST